MIVNILYDTRRKKFKIILLLRNMTITYYVNGVSLVTERGTLNLVKARNDVVADAKLVAIEGLKCRHRNNYGNYAEIWV